LTLPEVGVLQHVVGLVVLHPVEAQDLHHGVAEAAQGLGRVALHEHDHGVRPHQALHRLPRPPVSLAAPARGGAGPGRGLAE
uniref:Uncharacterized protein n=1 Tax=Pelodiscus sinensis TaxID=13735 RepID=K7EYL5_PELSI